MYTTSTRLADVIFADHSVITLLNRFGITLGVGDRNIGVICEEKGIDASFFTTLINIYTDSSCKQANEIGKDFVLPAIDYLKSTNEYYSVTALPNIERHFRALHQLSVGENNIEYLWVFFQELKRELQSRMASDNDYLFPYLSSICKRFSKGSVRYQFKDCQDADQAIEDKLDDLMSFFVIHLRGKYDQNLCMAVVTSLVTLKKDITRNNVIRQKLLRLAATRACIGNNSNHDDGSNLC